MCLLIAASGSRYKKFLTGRGAIDDDTAGAHNRPTTAANFKRDVIIYGRSDQFAFPIIFKRSVFTFYGNLLLLGRLNPTNYLVELVPKLRFGNPMS